MLGQDVSQQNVSVGTFFVAFSTNIFSCLVKKHFHLLLEMHDAVVAYDVGMSGAFFNA